MGLSVSIAFLDDLRRNDEEGFAEYTKQFARLSTYLTGEGHPGYEEPSALSVKLPPHVGSFPYSLLHYLRRAYAHAHAGAAVVPPCPPSEDPTEDDLIDEELTLHMSSHLVCHSDAEGFYVPLDFEEVLYPPEALQLPGGMVGSSFALLRELRVVAGPIGIALTDGAPSPQTLTALFEEAPGHPLARERMVWLTLWVNATASLAHRTAIVFS
jgi:hypothetical protein